MTRVGGILAHTVPLVWPEVWPLLRRAAPEDQDISEDRARDMLESGHAQLWAAWEDGRVVAAIATTIRRDWPVCVIELAGGSHLRAWLPAYWELVCAWARAQGCRCVIVPGRKGWRRLLNLRIGGSIDGRDRLLMFHPLEGTT